MSDTSDNTGLLVPYPPTQADLEEFVVFAVAVAGKNAASTRKAMEGLKYRLLAWGADKGLLYAIHNLAVTFKEASLAGEEKHLARLAKDSGFGCYNQRAKSWIELADRVWGKKPRLDLFTCTVEELEEVWGIGKKTSRFFIVYSRILSAARRETKDG